MKIPKIKKERARRRGETKVKIHPHPEMACPECKTNRWTTEVKGRAYACRKCGYIRIIEEL